MWIKPWGFKEGIAIGCGLFTTGILLQATIGCIRWNTFATPVNIIMLGTYLLLIAVIYLLRHRIYLFYWLSTSIGAVSALIWTVAITIIMGLLPQLPAHHPETDFPGFSQMLSQWSFFLIYLWLTTSLGLTILRVGFPLHCSKIPFWLNHTGLFICLTSATLGNADMQRLKMTVQTNKTEWRGVDDEGIVYELPLAVELQKFTIDEYPPKLILIDNYTGQILPANKPEQILLEEGVTKGTLSGWEITVEKLLPMAALVATTDTIRFTEFHSEGATTAMLVRARNTVTNTECRGWVSCSSFHFPYKALQLNDAVSLVIPEREPRRFMSAVKVYTESGSSFTDTITVNHPLKIEGWKIYQLSYDRAKGRWSDISVFELVRDPWLPYVYIGIWMLITGALCLFIRFPKRKEEKQ